MKLAMKKQRLYLQRSGGMSGEGEMHQRNILCRNGNINRIAQLARRRHVHVKTRNLQWP